MVFHFVLQNTTLQSNPQTKPSSVREPRGRCPRHGPPRRLVRSNIWTRSSREVSTEQGKWTGPVVEPAEYVYETCWENSTRWLNDFASLPRRPRSFSSLLVGRCKRKRKRDRERELQGKPTGTTANVTVSEISCCRHVHSLEELRNPRRSLPNRDREDYEPTRRVKLICPRL